MWQVFGNDIPAPTYVGAGISFPCTMGKRQSMRASTVSSKFQVVIPREIRERFKLKAGQKIMFIPYHLTLRVVIVPPIEKARGLLNGLDSEVGREEADEVR